MSNLPRFMIAAAHKSSGKTVISTGMAAALSRASNNPRTFKKGPDYIDPMWLGTASGHACYNLDFNTMKRDHIASFFASRAGALSLVEANKGLYDGMSLDGTDSNAELAKLLQLPVVLVIDTRGMMRGIAPLLIGYSTFDPDVQLAGVILNRVGGTRHEGKLRRAVETYTDLPVLGSVWSNGKLEIGERHLGLTTPVEAGGLHAMINGFADVISASVDMDRINELAAGAPALDAALLPVESQEKTGADLRIGVVQDRAFGFYYPDDLEAFQAVGAKLIPINAMQDSSLPDIDGLFIGGGFPEMQMEVLSANISLRHQLAAALKAGLPCYAECGGLMYLCESLSWNASTHDMVGLIPGQAVMHEQPIGRGYVSFRNTHSHPWEISVEPVKAHEFHYASIEGLPDEIVLTRTMIRGAGIAGGKDGIRVANTLAGFCHLRNSASVPWVSNFLAFVNRCKDR